MNMQTSMILGPKSPEWKWELIIYQPLFSKARPRMTKSGHTYMPQAYKDAQAEMRIYLREQWTEAPLEEPVMLHLDVQGEGRGDADNIMGAFFDSAVGIVFTDDRVKYIPQVSFEWHKAAKKDSMWRILIAPYNE